MHNQPSIKRYSWLLFAALASHGATVQAELQWNVYGTVGFGKTNNQTVTTNTAINYTEFTDELSSDELTRLGIQSSYAFNDKAKITLQAVTREAEDFDLEVEWGYLNYNLSENATLRAGLMRRPLFQYTDSLYVSYGYRWVQPPSIAYVDIEELYGSIKAVNLLYNGVLGNWLYSTELYFGAGDGEGSFAGQKTTNDTKNNIGIVLNVEQDNYSLRFGFHRSDFSLTINQVDPIGEALEGFGLTELADEIFLRDESTNFYSVAGSYFLNDWEFFGEYVSVDLDGTYIPKIDAHYLGIQRRLGDVSLQFTVGEQKTAPQDDPSIAILATASQIPDPATAAALQQIGQQFAGIVASGYARRSSKSVGIRYDISPTFALKAEIEQVTDKSLNDSANMVSMSVDFVY